MHTGAHCFTIEHCCNTHFRQCTLNTPYWLLPHRCQVFILHRIPLLRQGDNSEQERFELALNYRDRIRSAGVHCVNCMCRRVLLWRTTNCICYCNTVFNWNTVCCNATVTPCATVFTVCYCNTVCYCYTVCYCNGVPPTSTAMAGSANVDSPFTFKFHLARRTHLENLKTLSILIENYIIQNCFTQQRWIKREFLTTFDRNYWRQL